MLIFLYFHEVLDRIKDENGAGLPLVVFYLIFFTILYHNEITSDKFTKAHFYHLIVHIEGGVICSP